jgi:EmrB/QacA subfamily drug resistance transporter
MRAERGTLAAVVLGSGAVFLDGTVVNVALPRIGRELSHQFLGVLEGQSYAYNGYLLTLSALLIPAGALGDRAGRRRIYALGLAAFGLASLLCGVSPNLEMLVVFRLVQGAAGALLVPGSLALIRGTFSEQEQGKAIGTWAAATSGAVLLGPLVGGLLVDNVSWRAAFLINLPVIAAAGWLLWRYTPESFGERGRLDLVGAALAAVAVGGLSFGTIAGQQRQWHDPIAYVAIAVGAVAVIVLPLWLRRAEHPLVPLQLFRSRAFVVVNVATLLIYGALYVNGVYQALFLQGALGYAAAAVGLTFLPGGVMMVLLSRRFGALSSRIGPRLPMTIGPLFMAAGQLWMTRIPASSPGWHLMPDQIASWWPPAEFFVDVFPATMLSGLGISMLVAPLTAALMTSVAESHAGVASALNNALSRVGPQLGGAVVFVAVTAVFRAAAGAPGDRLSPFVPPAPVTASAAAFHVAMVICAVLAVAGSAVSWFGLPGRQPGVTQPHFDSTASPEPPSTVPRSRSTPPGRS